MAALALGLVFVAGSAGRPAATSTYPIPRVATAKLDSQIGEVVKAQRASGTGAAVAAADANDLDVSGTKVKVVVDAADGAGAAAASAVRAAGGAVTGQAGDLLDALVPTSGLASLAARPSVDEVRPPMVPVADSVSEAVAQSGAAAWQNASTDGTGVKIAIIDLGFNGYASSIPSGSIAGTVNYCGSDFSSGAATIHGTAVAQLVHQMAPGAQLYLMCVVDEVDLANAEAAAVADGVKIISHSVSWFGTSWDDGTGDDGTPNAIAADARSHGILWVNSAGNEGEDHWGGDYTPLSSNPDLNDFTGSGQPKEFVTIQGGEQACAALTWDDWPVTSEDFDLILYDGSGNVVAFSDNDQEGGGQSPSEVLCYTNHGSTQQYYLEISRWSAAGTPDMSLFWTGSGTFAAHGSGSSVTEPASSPSVLAVGAVCQSTSRTEDYSSTGPTSDGRPKPELYAPDSVSGTVYGDYSSSDGCGASGFAGTSAAAPEVAGAAALVLQHDSSLTPGELEARLEAAASDDNSGERVLALPQLTASARIVGVASSSSRPWGDAVAMNSDGTGFQALTSVEGTDLSPSPDGSQFVLATEGSTNQLAVLDPGQTTSSTLIADNSNQTWPAWSPDGTEIAYTCGTRLCEVKPDGTAITTITSGAASQAAWSPDSSELVFVNGGLWRVDADGNNLVQLTTSSSDQQPSWSPDGTKIVFSSDRGAGGGRDIYTVSATDGSGLTRLTTAATADTSPTWSPDGSQIAWLANGHLATMTSSGTGQTAASFSPATLTRIAWESSSSVTKAPWPSSGNEISGTLTGGSALTAGIGTWSGGFPLGYTFQWQRCAPTCADVSGATDSSYAVPGTDVNLDYQVIVTATNNGGSSSLTEGPVHLPYEAVPQLQETSGAATALPTFTGTAQVGQTLSLFNVGSWTPSPVSYEQWWRCADDGSTCRAIGGATAIDYTVTSADLGSTLRLAIEATTGGDSNFAMSEPSDVVTNASSGGGGGGTSGGGGGGGGTTGGGGGSGGGGGGGGGPLDLVTSISASASQVAVGGDVTFHIQVTDPNHAPANNMHVTVQLPAGGSVLFAQADRGPGCGGASSSGIVSCNLDYLSDNSPVGNVILDVRLSTAGQATLTATASATQTDVKPSNNTASATVQVGAVTAPGGTTTPPTTTTGGGTTTTPTRTATLPAVHTETGTAKADHLTGTAKVDHINAGAGNDTVNAGAGNDTVNGGAGNDTLYGGAGNDKITGGPGADKISGGPGNDTIYARDGARDTIDCGPGHDVVFADRKDVVAKNCEVVHRG